MAGRLAFRQVQGIAECRQQLGPAYLGGEDRLVQQARLLYPPQLHKVV